MAKTGTTLVEALINKNLKDNEFYSINISADGRLDKSDLHKHSTMQEIGFKIPESKKCWKFSFVRNPYSRVVSWFSYLTQGLNAVAIQKKHAEWFGVDYLSGDFKDFCNFAPYWVFHNQFDHLCNEHKNIDFDFIGRFENFSKDLDTVFRKIGIPKQKLPHKNKSNHKHYTEYYDDETRQIVAEKYAKDIEYFGYEFGE